jgi:uroporphyrinogen decarboxylase
MTPREIVRRTVRFQGAPRMPYDLDPAFGSDIHWVTVDPHPDGRPKNGPDEWGAVWENIGVSKMGQVKTYPLRDWKDFGKLKIPDAADPKRYATLADQVRAGGDKFILSYGSSLYERVHFLRGLEDAWMDIYENEDHLRKLVDLLVEMNLELIKRYAAAGADGYFWADDWGLQDRLMISPEKWRQIWKPAYARVYAACHQAGLLTFLHSCGYIVDILDDLIGAGLDVISMDQQENMTLDLLSKRFRGRITFYNPVDIQQTMIHGSPDDIRAYARRMVKMLSTPQGGFIAKWYTDPLGAGHRPEAVSAMCDEFLVISRKRTGRLDEARNLGRLKSRRGSERWCAPSMTRSMP